MTNFNESKLSKIIARAIVAPEDRAPFTALATPVYCPSNNGVRANRLTIIKPFPIATIQQAKAGSAGSPSNVDGSYSIGGDRTNITTTTEVDYTTDTIAYMDNFFDANQELDFTKDFDIEFTYVYPTSQTAGGQYTYFNYNEEDDGMYSNTIVIRVNATVADSAVSNVEISVGSTKENATVNLFAQMQDPPLVVGSGYRFKFHWNASSEHFDMTITEYTTGRLLYSGVRPGANPDGVKTGADVQDGSYYALANVDNYTASSPLLSRTDVTYSTEFTKVNNKMDITLDKSIELTYNVPYEVDLETDVNLQDLIKADALVQFKKAVNQEIATLINSNKASITSVVAGTTLADTIGTLIANNIIDGTGCKFSVYSYNNGAPVEYVQSGDQLKFRNLIQNEDGSFYFADIQEANVPAMYYINTPSLILDETNFTDLQVALCDGTVKRYATERINFDVDSTSNLTTTIGADGIFGTNDSFAVAFTEPHISVTPKHTDFTYDVSVVIYFGVGLVYLDNLQKITST